MLCSQTMNKMLTFEITPDGNVEIHADEEGLLTLTRRLEQLHLQGGHVHLMTASWGGEDLSEDKQGEGNRLVQHALVFLWPESEGGRDARTEERG